MFIPICRKPTLFALGGTAVGLYLYNSNAATKEKKARRDREEATERHNREMERYKRDMERYKREREINDRIFKLQMTH